MTRPTGGAPRVVAAVDIGASGGRVIAGLISPDGVELDEIHRFANGVTELDGHLRWDIERIHDEVLAGLQQVVARYPHVESIGIDTWGVDYGCLDSSGDLLAPPVAYRDARTTTAVIDEVHALVSPAQLYAINGLQHLPFNTIYQLAAQRHDPLWPAIEHIALIPDLIAYLLTGVLATDYTNATTTGLIDAQTRTWSTVILDRLGLPHGLVPRVEQPGTIRGLLLPEVAHQIGLSHAVAVNTVGSHDTASAFVGVPATEAHAAFIASGTWSLVGVELNAPITSDAARAANFTNEGGVDGTIRFLRNLGGLWLLQECQRHWAADHGPPDLAQLLAGAAAAAESRTLIDVDDPAFIAPDDMPQRIATAVEAAGGEPPTTPFETTRVILDSLAAAYARTIDQAESLTGQTITTVHVVGGGSQNELLCQLTAQATRRPVIAGPVEATALGNVLLQARAIGARLGTLAELRQTTAHSFRLTRYDPW